MGAIEEDGLVGRQCVLVRGHQARLDEQARALLAHRRRRRARCSRLAAGRVSDRHSVDEQLGRLRWVDETNCGLMMWTQIPHLWPHLLQALLDTAAVAHGLRFGSTRH